MAKIEYEAKMYAEVKRAMAALHRFPCPCCDKTLGWDECERSKWTRFYNRMASQLHVKCANSSCGVYRRAIFHDQAIRAKGPYKAWVEPKFPEEIQIGLETIHSSGLVATYTIYDPDGNVVQGTTPVTVNQNVSSWTSTSGSNRLTDVHPELNQIFVSDRPPKGEPTKEGLEEDERSNRIRRIVSEAYGEIEQKLSDRREVCRKLASWPVCAPCGGSMEFIGINPCPGRRDAVFLCRSCDSTLKVKLK